MFDTSIPYASNKKKGMTNESEYNGSEISKLFRRDEVLDGADPFKDKFLQSLKKSSQKYVWRKVRRGSF